ncbi:hypothetical protein LWF01_15805 [Saxibacter everestensis]|uniref:BTB domain-containing protein n=1 Tax=Saxibacter everestensis TaxID=2909229 RepID=A0ABY8QRA6_9MICO|nr:hypothetical protein LWF01_15805 [Brevibacteriaceae bacterium ZFBP1038]
MSVFSSEASFGAILDMLYHGSLDERDEREEGGKFERLIRVYLQTDPTYAAQFNDVWLWEDLPGRHGRGDTASTSSCRKAVPAISLRCSCPQQEGTELEILSEEEFLLGEEGENGCTTNCYA